MRFNRYRYAQACLFPIGNKPTGWTEVYFLVGHVHTKRPVNTVTMYEKPKINWEDILVIIAYFVIVIAAGIFVSILIDYFQNINMLKMKQQ